MNTMEAGKGRKQIQLPFGLHMFSFGLAPNLLSTRAIFIIGDNGTATVNAYSRDSGDVVSATLEMQSRDWFL